MTKKVRILIADDHTMFRESLKEVINSKPEYHVVAMAASGLHAVALVKKHKPDVVILDINMPHKNGIEVAKELRKERVNIKIIILTMLENESYILDALRYNVEGFLYKDAKINELLKAIDLVSKGEQYITSEIKKKVMHFITSGKYKYSEQEEKKDIALTPRQIEIIKHVAQGLTSKEVAEKLFLSELTVIKHKKNIIKKLNLKNFMEVVSFAHQEKLI
ncbi:response regulator transcription factor [Candidatus Woesearchaeota archaeon]|nr:response regulator transcription factor [Candidatus Woesearchaeota archaeon]